MNIVTSIIDAASGYRPVAYPGVETATTDAGADEPSPWIGGWAKPDGSEGPREEIDPKVAKTWADRREPGKIYLLDMYESGIPDDKAANVRAMLKPNYARGLRTGLFCFPTIDDAYNRRVYTSLAGYMRLLTPAYYFGEVSDELQPHEALAIVELIAATQRLNSKKPVYFVWRAHTHAGAAVSLTKLGQMFDLLIAMRVDGAIQWDEIANEHTKAACDMAIAKANQQ